MSAHHWIHNHCTACGMKREKVRVQGPCNKDLFAGVVRSSEPARLGGAVTEPPMPIEEAVELGIEAAKRTASQEAFVERMKLMAHVERPQLFAPDGSIRSIEPHKKRREK